MAEVADPKDPPQIYLIVTDGPGWTSDGLAAALDAVPVGCVRLETASRDEAEISQWADAYREVCHARDVAVVLAEHAALAVRLGLDGVHMMGTKDLRDAREAVGRDAILGTFCGASRHAGLNAGEIGADYVSFGPVSDTGLGTGDVVDEEVFSWWCDVVEVPVVAEGGLTPDRIETLAPFVEFFAIGPEISQSDDRPRALADLHRIATGA